MKTPSELIKEKYPFYDNEKLTHDVELCGEQVEELMLQYADEAVKNNVGLADVMHRRELLIALVHFAYNDKVCVGKEPEEVLDLFLCN